MKMVSRSGAARRGRAALVSLAVLTLAACGGARSAGGEPMPPGMAPGGVVLTQDEIAPLNVRSAMDVLERVPGHLTIARSRAGGPTKVTTRGRNSLVLSPELLLVVDGARAKHFVQMLQSIPAESILFMQILTGREAALHWGSEAANGVIIVKTSAR